MDEFTTLVLQAQAGHTDAYSQIVLRFQDMAYGYAFAILGDFHMAEDAAQEAFIEAYRCLPDLREPLAFPAWFKRIVFKHCDRLTRRKQLAWLPLEEIDSLASPVPSPVEVAEYHEMTRRVQEAIQGLPVEQRIATTLFYIDGYSQHEIADFLDVPAKTVKSRLHASRQRLRERMMDMVHETFKAHALPEHFAQDTVEQAVARAEAFNRERQYDQAESLLREVLDRLPDHPAALKTLNRTLMHGRVYGQGRWDLLPELAQKGKVILQSTDDEEVFRQLAQTLLAVPAMTEAIDFIQSWIARKGPNLERLGMLAWAKGCVADYGSAQKLWQDLLALVKTVPADELLSRVPFVAYTLVDCLAEGGEIQQAQAIAQEAWACGGNLGAVPFGYGMPGDGIWMMIFRQAGLDLQDVASELIKRHTGVDPAERGMRLYLRAWVEDPTQVGQDWLSWVQERVSAGEWNLLEQFRCILFAQRDRDLWDEANQLAQATWDLLGSCGMEGAAQARIPWNWERFNPVGAIKSRNWLAAETLSRRELQECGLRQGGPWAIVIAAAQSKPSPPQLVQAVETCGIDSVDEYGLFGWYLVARQAAVAGAVEKALTALDKSLSYWANSPYFYSNIWEQDACWDFLRGDEQFKRLFAEQRRQVGPIHGMLHYFPGW